METHSFSETDRILIANLTASNNRLAAALEAQIGEKVYTCKEAAQLLGKSQQTISRYLAKGRLKKGVRGGMVGIPQSEIDKILTPTP